MRRTDPQREQIIATVSRREMGRIFIGPGIMFGVMIFEAVVLYLLNSVGPATGGFGSRPFALFIIGMMVASLFSMSIGLVKQFFEEALIVLDGRLTFRTRKYLLSSIALENIVELQIRNTGTFMQAGLDRGIGIVLRKAEVRNFAGGTNRLGPAINFAMRKYHLVAAYVYNEPLDAIACRIADAVEAATGQTVPIRVTSANKLGLPMGRPVETFVPTARPASGAPVLATAGTLCIDCGYDLRLLAATAVCPECATPVERSLGGHLLHRCDPVWLASLRRGAGFTSTASVLAVAGLCVTLRGIYIRYGNGGNGGLEFMFAAMLVAAGLPLFLLGMSYVTRKQPSRSGLTGDPLTRRLTRWAMFGLPFFLLARVIGIIPTFVMVQSWAWSVLLIAALALLFFRQIWKRVPSAGWGRAAAIAFSYFIFPVVIWLIFLVPQWLGRIVRGMPSFAPSPAASRPARDEVYRGLLFFAGTSTTYPVIFSILSIALWLHLRRTHAAAVALAAVEPTAPTVITARAAVVESPEPAAR